MVVAIFPLFCVIVQTLLYRGSSQPVSFLNAVNILQRHQENDTHNRLVR